MNSLRNKIILAFSLSNAVILLVAILVSADLNYLRDEIIQGEKVRDFLSATWKLLDQEEHLLIKQEPEAYFGLHARLDELNELFVQFKPLFANEYSASELEQLEFGLIQYARLLEDLLDLSGRELARTQRDLHATGQGILLLVRELGHRHHLMLRQKTELATWTLIAALSVVVALGVAGALFIVKKVIRPITALDNQLDAVAERRKTKLTLPSEDIEIKSFVQHFNAMLGRLRSQQSQLRHHEKAAALGVLVSGVAHELNNPLSNISTSVQLLLEDDDTTKPDLQRQWLDHIDSETERARRIVRRLLDSVRHPELNMQTTGAAALVRSAALLTHRQLDPALNLHIEDISDTCIRVDRERMQQVLINLIRNAADAGACNIWVFGDSTTWEESVPDDFDRVHGDVSAISDAGQLLLYTIADDGSGISDEHLSLLFTPFFTTKTGGEGTGLGLYLVAEIVDEHDGCITVEHRPGGGTQFLIWLPAAGENCEQ